MYAWAMSIWNMKAGEFGVTLVLWLCFAYGFWHIHNIIMTKRTLSVFRKQQQYLRLR